MPVRILLRDDARSYRLAGQCVPDEHHPAVVARHTAATVGRRPDGKREFGQSKNPRRASPGAFCGCRRFSRSDELSCHGTDVTITPGSNSSLPFSRVCANVSLRNGRPRNSRRVAVDSFDTRTNPMRSGGVAVALCEQFPRVAAALHRKGPTLRVVVMGCGRVGASLADALARIGHEVAVIDRDATAFNRLSPEFSGERVLGMGFDRDVLLRSGIEEAGAFAAVSSGDTSNTISARGARETFGVQRVVARIYDAKRAAVYERLGIPTVATVPGTTDRLLNVLTREAETTKWRDPSGNVGVAEVPLHEDWVGHRVTELESATGARVAFMIRFGNGLLPGPKTVIQASDQVYIAAVSGRIAEALAIAALPPSEDTGG